MFTKAVDVLKCYLYLDPIIVLVQIGEAMLHTLTNLLQNLTVNASKHIFELLDVMILSCHQKQHTLQLIEAMKQTSLYQVLLNGLLGNGGGDGWVGVGYCTTLCRIWMFEPMEISQDVLNVVLERFDTMDSRQKCICAMGLTSCAATGNPILLQQFEAVVALITSIPVLEQQHDIEEYKKIDKISSIPFIKLKLQQLGMIVDLNVVLESVDSDLVLELKKLVS
jgi:hypothetical protein